MKQGLPDPQVLALALQATVLAHARLREAATAFASELANGKGCARVGVGFVRRHQVELVGLSHGSGENLHRQAFNLLTAAMDEAVQQGASVHWPADGPPAIRHAHRALLNQRGGAVATVPIVHLGRAVGAVTCEWSAPPADWAALMSELENHISLAGPGLYLMAQREMSWYQRQREWLAAARAPGRR